MPEFWKGKFIYQGPVIKKEFIWNLGYLQKDVADGKLSEFFGLEPHEANSAMLNVSTGEFDYPVPLKIVNGWCFLDSVPSDCCKVVDGWKIITVSSVELVSEHA